MLQKRVIPCLLLHKGGLYKTEKFKKPTYIGDPINAIKIFNEKEVDELMFLDIDASVENKEPNYKMIEDIASECFMPLCYGGGVKNIEQMKKIYALGVEKVSLSSQAVINLNLIKEAANIFGNQSVIVTIDIKKDFWGNKKVFVNNAKKNTKLNPIDFIKQVESLGAGEIVINSCDNDGIMKGYDIELLKEIKESKGDLGDMILVYNKFKEQFIDTLNPIDRKSLVEYIKENSPLELEKEDKAASILR